MTKVAGKSRVNRPFFFREMDGSRMEVPAFGTGQGDLEGSQLREFNMYVRAGQISPADVKFPPENTVPPSITGTAQVGETLTVTNGTWEGHPAPTYSRQWRRGTTDIAGATGTTYTLVEADVGQIITCVVTATNSEGSNTATANGVGPVAGIAPSFTVDPVLSGTPTVGETLSVTNGTAGGIPAATFTRAWLRDGVEIAGATGTTRVLTEDDLGARISVRVTATNSAGSDVAISNELGPVVAPEPDPEPDPEPEG